MNTKVKKMLLILLTTIIVLVAYRNFFKFHLVSDAYRIINTTPEYIINLKCNEGRIVQVIYFSILNVLNISINSIDMYMFIYRINYVISMLLMIISVLLTYKILISYMKNITSSNKIIVYLCTLLIFINVSVSEYMLFFENFVMIFGLLLSIIAAQIYHSHIKFKNIIILSLILISSFCHQGVTQIFVILAALILLISKPEQKQRYYLKEILKILVLYFLPLLINYIICWWLNSILPNLDPRIFIGVLESLKQLVSWQNLLVLSIYMMLFGILILFNFRILIGKNIFGVIYLIMLSIISFEIFIFNNEAGLFPRILLNFIIIYPILKIYIINLKEDNKYIIDIILIVLLLILNIFIVSYLQVKNVNSTTKNIEAVQSIIDKINEYESENNIEVKNVAFYVDANINYKYWDAEEIMYFSYTAPIYYGYWCDIYSINVLSGKEYKRVNNLLVDKEIYYYFKTKDWDEVNLEEQLIFRGDTIHICRF